MMGLLERLGPKKLAMIGGGSVALVAILVVVLVLVLGRAPAAGTADEAAQRLERALRAGDADAVVALFHPEIRDAAREGYEETLTDEGEAAVKEELQLIGEGFSDRNIRSQDESRVVYEFQVEGETGSLEFRSLDGEWWLWD